MKEPSAQLESSPSPKELTDSQKVDSQKVDSQKVDSQKVDSQSVDSRRGQFWLFALTAPMLLGPLWVWATGPVEELRPVHGLPGFVLVFTLLLCAATDIYDNYTPNWATYPAALWGLILAILTTLATPAAMAPERFSELPMTRDAALTMDGLLRGHLFVGARPVIDVDAPGLMVTDFPWPGLGGFFAGFFACFFSTFFIYSLSGGGAGDVKLAAAVGGLLGLFRGLEALLFTYIFAGTAAVTWAIVSEGPITITRSFLRRVGSWVLPALIRAPTEEQKEVLTRKVPLAAFTAMGTFASMFGLMEALPDASSIRSS